MKIGVEIQVNGCVHPHALFIEASLESNSVYC